jgi:hypothetical protein
MAEKPYTRYGKLYLLAVIERRNNNSKGDIDESPLYWGYR